MWSQHTLPDSIDEGHLSSSSTDWLHIACIRDDFRMLNYFHVTLLSNNKYRYVLFLIHNSDYSAVLCVHDSYKTILETHIYSLEEGAPAEQNWTSLLANLECLLQIINSLREKFILKSREQN